MATPAINNQAYQFQTYQPAQQYPGAKAQMPEAVPVPIKVDFARDAHIHTRINELNGVLKLALNERKLAEAAYKKETGRTELPFQAHFVAPSTLPELDPTKPYDVLVKEMQARKAKCKSDARDAASSMYELNQEINKQKEITQYLNKLTQQVHHTRPKAQVSQGNAINRAIDQSSLQTQAALVVAVFAGLSSCFSGQADASILTSLYTFAAIKFLPQAIMKIADNLSSHIPAPIQFIRYV